MKKSERKKVKLLMLKYVSQKVDVAKEDLAASWSCKGVPGARKAISCEIKVLHGTLFVQHAVEKQMPMPMVVKVQYGIHKHRVEKYCYQCGQKLWWPSC